MMMIQQHFQKAVSCFVADICFEDGFGQIRLGDKQKQNQLERDLEAV
jgi:hypothetical protein